MNAFYGQNYNLSVAYNNSSQYFPITGFENFDPGVC